MECFNCSQKESSIKVGLNLQWSKFEVQTSRNQSDDDLKIICLSCGHSYRRCSLGMAKYKYLDTVHLCLVFDGHAFSSRCGMLSGSITHNLDEIVNISTYHRACRKCAREEGVSLSFYKKWLSSQDKELELEFYRHL